MEKVMVATDLSPAGCRAVERGILLSRQTGAWLHVVHAIPEFLPRERHERRLARARELIHQHLASQAFGGAGGVTVSVISGERARCIVRHAEDIDADLTIIGTSPSEKPCWPIRPIRRKVLCDGFGALLVVREEAKNYYRRTLFASDNGTDLPAATAAVRRIVPNTSIRFVRADAVPMRGRAAVAHRICDAKRDVSADLLAVSVVRSDSFLRVPFRSLALTLVGEAACDTLVVPAT